MSPFDLIAYDTETTGLINNTAIPLKDQPRIIELYAMRCRWDGEELHEVEQWQSLFYSKEVPEEVQKITGITPAMTQAAPTFDSMLDDLSDFFLGAKWLVGHNLSYDRDMLWMELRRRQCECRFPWPPRHLCTVEATEAMKGFRLNLTALHEELFGMGFDAAHRAQSDVTATVRCLRELLKRKVIRL